MQEWQIQKQIEVEAQKNRREIENRLSELLLIDDSQDGTINYEEEDLKATITVRLKRSVDSDTLQDIAAENGLSSHLSHLFRWKPEIDSRAWKKADQKVTDLLLGAIETKPGRPSFKIVKI